MPNVIVKYGAESFSISIASNTGDQIDVGDHPPHTLLALQQAIEQATGVMVRHQKLICKGKVLTNSPPKTTLSAAGITDGAKIMLIAAANPTPTQGAVALQAAQRAKMEALKQRLASSSSLSQQLHRPPPPPPTCSFDARAQTWAKTGIAALRDLKLTSLPSMIFSEPAAGCLRVGDFGGNKLSSLPPSISKFVRLQKLRLSINALTDDGMPWEALSGLTNLVVLCLDHNRFTTIPPFIFTQLTNLQKLAMDHNAIANIPETIGALNQLKSLNINDNKLTCLPPSLSSCQCLEEVDASRNKGVVKIPEEYGALKSLKTLLVNDTLVDSVPSGVLRHASSLHTLGLHGCPITMETFREIEGFEEFDARRRQKYDKQIDMKVIGQGGGFDPGADVQEWEHWRD